MSEQTDEPGPGTAVATAPQPFSGILATQQSRAVFLPANLAQAMELAHFMAGGIGVRQWMRGNPSACLALIQISMRWGMDPYIVANKAYYTNDTLAFESQLVNAVLNTSGELVGRLKVEFTGDANGKVGEETLNCRVSGRLRADPDQVFIHEQALQTIKIRNSPIWQVNPRQQLQYHATRAWARLYMPEVLLGIYTPDEVVDGVAARMEDQSALRSNEPAPDRRSFESDATDAEYEEIRPFAPADGEETPENPDKGEKIVEKGEGKPKKTAEKRESGQEKPPGEDLIDDEIPNFDQPKGEESRCEGQDAPPATDLPPTDPPGWAAWKERVTGRIGEISSMDEFNSVRKRIQPALDAAEDPLQDEIQDLLADKLAILPEPERKA